MAEVKKIALTGDRPTGRLHLGHFVGSIKNRVKMQDEYKQYVMVADVQALTDNAERPEKVRNNILETTIDNIATGVDPGKTTFFVQSMIPEIAELTIFFLNLVSVARLTQNPTVRAEMREKGFELDRAGAEKATPGELVARASVPAGFLCYPVSQAADILFVKANVVPVGEDQKPMIEQTNEIAIKFNSLYGEVFPHVQAIIPSVARLSGTDGRAKMGKSLGNCIYLSDTCEQIAEKVRGMYTDPEHIHVEQPGRVEGNIVFEYLDVFDKDEAEVARLKDHYRAGGLGDIAIKERLAGVLEGVIAPMREQREYLAKNPNHVLDILKSGTEETREVSARTLAEVKKAMQINYF